MAHTRLPASAGRIRRKIPRVNPFWLDLFLLACVLGARVVAWISAPLVRVLSPILLVVIYTGILGLLVLEKERLKSFHVDRPSLAIILVGGALSGLVYTPSLITCTLSAIMLGSAICAGRLLRKDDVRVETNRQGQVWWLLTAPLLGVGLALLLGVLRLLIDGERASITITHPSIVIVSFVASFAAYLASAGVIEEPLFRGFTWGYLTQRGMRESWVLVAQTLLFSAAHIDRLGSNPLDFWINVPLAGLALGMVAWRSRSLAPAMVLHAAYNATASLLPLLLHTLSP